MPVWTLSLLPPDYGNVAVCLYALLF